MTASPQTVSPAIVSQAAFRSAMDAFARPGTISHLGDSSAPPALMPATAALVKCLADYETPLWLDPAFANNGEITSWIRFQTGAPLTEHPAKATFALVASGAQLPDFSIFCQGSEEYPDRSTTLIAQIDGFDGPAFALSGPGIKGSRTIHAKPLPADFVARMADNLALYPRGVDLVLVSGDAIMALPRSVRVAAQEA